MIRRTYVIQAVSVPLFVFAIFLVAADAGKGLWIRTAPDIFCAVIAVVLFLRQITIRRKLTADAAKEFFIR
jgi:hypothetical protein